MANQNSSNQEYGNKPKNQGDSFSQQGNFGLGDISDGEVKGNAKVAGVIEQLQEIIGRNFNQAKNIINIENLYITEPKDAEEGIIKVILKGSPTEFEQLEQLLQSGELGELIKILEKEFKTQVKYSSFVDNETSKNYPKDQVPRIIKKHLDFTIFDQNNMKSTTVILIIFPYSGWYSSDSDLEQNSDSDLEQNFWELIKNCQEYSKYKPVVIINEDTVNKDQADIFYQKNSVGTNSIVNTTNLYSILSADKDTVDNKKIVDCLQVWSVDTCQMWLHG